MEIKLKLYLLELENDKYYVGQSDDPAFRFHDHLKGKGAKWTQLHKPLRVLMTRDMVVQSPAEGMLEENRMTLQFMERFGWENVRGGDYVVVESFKLQERISHIYDSKHNKIRHFVPDCRYLFGSFGEWHIYILELANGCFYIGSYQKLGKSLAAHFDGKSIAWTRDNKVLKVIDLITIKPVSDNYLKLKERLLTGYISRYGWEKVRGCYMPARQ